VVVERPCKARQPHSLHDPTASFIFPDQQIRDFARIVKIASHQPSRDDWDVLAVEPGSEPEEVLVRSAPLFSLLHRLIPVTVLSSKIPLRGRICKESVKVCTSKSPPSTDNAPLDLFSAYVTAQRARAEAQHIRCLAQREQSVSNRRNPHFRFLFGLIGFVSVLRLFYACSQTQNLGAKWAQNPGFLGSNWGKTGE
jgi:hypothetical protein